MNTNNNAVNMSNKEQAVNLKNLLVKYGVKQLIDLGILKLIGKGSGRSVYASPVYKGVVVKRARNNKGLVQNNMETDTAFLSYSDILAVCYKSGPIVKDIGPSWIIAERVSAIKPKDLVRLTGLDHEGFANMMITWRIIVLKEKQQKWYSCLNDKLRQEYDKGEDGFLIRLRNLYYDFNCRLADMAGNGNIGIKPDGTLCIIDYGLTIDLYNEYYRR